MENENENADSQNGEQDLELETESGSESSDKQEPKEKKQFTPKEQLAIHERQAKKLRKELGLDNETPSKSKDKASKSEDFDYGQLAFLAAKGINTDEEIAFAQQIVKDTGKELKDVVGSKYFQSEIKELREANTSANAIPKGTKRSSNSSVSDVDYWIAKGELPADTVENRELRQKIVAEERKREANKNIFGGSSKIIIK